MDYDYLQEDRLLKKLFEVSRGVDREALMALGATARDAWIVVTLREAASPLLLEWWLSGKPFRRTRAIGGKPSVLTFRTLWRVVCNYPFDSATQEWALSGSKRGKGDHPFKLKKRLAALDAPSEKTPPFE